MLIAYQLGVSEGAKSLIAPVPVPSNYKSREAIDKHIAKYRDDAGQRALETPACLQPIGVCIQQEAGGKLVGTSVHHQGPPAVWALSMLPLAVPGETIWCFRPFMFCRAVALTCLRLKVAKVPGSLLRGDGFCDPFDLLFGDDKRLDRVACLRSVGIRPEIDSTLDEQLRVLRACATMVG